MSISAGVRALPEAMAKVLIEGLEQNNNDKVGAAARAHIAAIGHAIVTEGVLEDTPDNRVAIECFLNYIFSISGLRPGFYPEGYSGASLAGGFQSAVCFLEFVERYISGESLLSILSKDSTTELVFALKSTYSRYSIDIDDLTSEFSPILRLSIMPFIKAVYAELEGPDVNSSSAEFMELEGAYCSSVINAVIRAVSDMSIDPDANNVFMKGTTDRILTECDSHQGHLFMKESLASDLNKVVQSAVESSLDGFLSDMGVTKKKQIKKLYNSTVCFASAVISGYILKLVYSEAMAEMADAWTNRLRTELLTRLRNPKLKMKIVLDGASVNVDKFIEDELSNVKTSPIEDLLNKLSVDIKAVGSGVNLDSNSLHTSESLKRIVMSDKDDLLEVLSTDEDSGNKRRGGKKTTADKILLADKNSTPHGILNISKRESEESRKAFAKTLIESIKVMRSAEL